MTVPSASEDAADLLRDGREHLGRWQPAGDQRGDPAQRGLLVGEPVEFVAAVLELGAALGVRDRGRDEFGEVGYALFGVGREVLASRPGADRAPQPPLDHDRRRDPRPDSQPAEAVAVDVGHLAEVVEAGRVAGAQGDRQRQGRFECPAAPHRELVGVCGADAGHDGRCAVGVEADDGRGVGIEDVADLVRDGREHLAWWCPAGDQGGDPAQGGLLVGEAVEFVAAVLELGAALGVRDRGADEFGEVGYALFGVGREALVSGPDGDRAPQVSLDGDRRCDPRSESQPADGVAVGVAGVAEVVDAGRVAGAQDRRQGQRRLGPPAASDRELGGVRADAGHDGRRTVGIEADDVRAVGAEDVADLVCDGREHLGRRRPAGDQRGDAAQRGLLVGEPAEFLAALGVRGREGFGVTVVRGQGGDRADRGGGEEERDKGHHIVGVGDGEVVRRDDVVGQQRRGRDRGGQRRNQPTDQGHDHDGEQVEQHRAGQVHDVAELGHTQGQQGKDDQPGQRPGEPTPQGKPRPPRRQP